MQLRNHLCRAVGVAGLSMTGGAAGAGGFGGFSDQVEISVGAPMAQVTDVVIADLDGDGDLDIAATVFTADTFDEVRILLNLGNGLAWAPPASYSVGSDPVALVEGDVDNDGDTDLIVSNRGSDDVSVLRNTGNGGFLPEVIVGVGNVPQGVDAGDLNNDGDLDFVVANDADATVSVHYGDGTGSAWTAGPVITTHNGGGTGGLRPRDVKAVDLNFNGQLDIVTVNTDSASCTVLYAVPGSAGSWFSGGFAIFVSVQSRPVALEIGDVDGDGDRDIAVAHAFPSNSVSTRLSNFDSGVTFPAFSGGTNQIIGTDLIGDLKLADIESGGGLGSRADGDLDILAIEDNRSLLHARLNNGAGSFSFGGTFGAGSTPDSLDVGDLDGDGDVDAAVGNFNGGTISIFLNESTVVGGPPPIASFLGLGDGDCLCGPSVLIQGTAASAGGPFGSYVLEYRRLGDPSFTTIDSDSDEVVGDDLGVWNTAGLPEGQYVLRLTAFNGGGISSTVEVVVWLSQGFNTVDTFAAAGLSTAGIGSASIVGGRSCIWGDVIDNGCGPVEYMAEYAPTGGGTFLPVDPGSPVYSGNRINESVADWNTGALGLPDGDYRIRVSATNGCGNMGVDEFALTVDNTAPVALIDSPADCDYLDPFASIVFEGTAFDDNLSSWSLAYTGGGDNGWTTIASSSSNVVNGVLASWDISGLRPCAYTVRLRVGDRAVVNCNGGRVRDYLVSFNIGCRADLAEPFNELNFNDVIEYLNEFAAGCGE